MESSALRAEDSKVPNSKPPLPRRLLREDRRPDPVLPEGPPRREHQSWVRQADLDTCRRTDGQVADTAEVANEARRIPACTLASPRLDDDPLSCAPSRTEHSSPMPRSSSHPFDALVERFAQILVDRISAAMPTGSTRRNGNGAARSSRRGMKRDMSCRYLGCKNRSKGPRFRFLCEEHLRLPKKKQDEMLAKWEAPRA